MFFAFMKPKKSLNYYNKNFRDEYRNSWINNIKEYTP